MRQLDHAVRAPATRAPRPAPLAHHTGAPVATPTFRPTPPAAPSPSQLAPSAGGQPLPAPLLTEMESGFGTSLGHVRLHHGPSADRAAHDLDARAFTLGPHVVFGGDQFRPDSAEGRGLIAHELAHVAQDAGSRPTTTEIAHDPAAESEADEAARALARGQRVSVSRRRATGVRRAPKAAPPPPALPPQAPGAGATNSTATVAKDAAAQPATTAPPSVRLPPGMTAVVDEPSGLGTKELVVELASFALPLEKGAGSWVQKAYDDAAAGGRLVFSPLIQGNSVAAYKEGGEDYKSIWLGKFGFASTGAVADAFAKTAKTNADVKTALDNKEVKALIDGLRTNLKSSKCDIDHIVEKQMGGTSIPSNLQLLTSTKNQASGRDTYQALVEVVSRIRADDMRGKNVRSLQIRIKKAVVPGGAEDASFVVEDLLRKGTVVGSDAEKAKADGKPVTLMAGGQGETVSLRDTGSTPLDSMAKRIVPGMRLNTYQRGAAGAKSKADSVEGELDSRAVRTTGAPSTVHLTAELSQGGSAAPAAAAGDAAADATAAPVGEARVLKLDKAKNKKIAFYYPYLSPGELTKVELDEQGAVRGEGTISSSVPFFGKLNVRYSKDELALVAPIPADKLVSPLPSAFRFTGGELKLQLSPELVPDAQLKFEVGPAAKPLMLGELKVTVLNGAVVATGKLLPASKLPGVTAAEGVVEWNSEKGWSGKLKATSSTSGVTGTVEIGFVTAAGKLDPYATGTLSTTVKGSSLVLTAQWDGQGLVYHGSVEVPKPLPLVDKVTLKGRYSDKGLWLQGDAAIVWKQFSATMKVEYSRKEEEEEGKFSGSSTITIKTEKADGSLVLNFDEKGNYWGKGSIGYQVTKSIKPTLGVELTPDHRVKVTGEVAVADIPLSGMWPKPEGGEVSIIKGVGVKFDIPTPVPAVTAFGEIRGSLGIRYGVGPVMLKAVVFKGELFPLEDDPQVKAKLAGTLAVPAYGELFGTFGAYIGLEVALGAVGAKGGIEITPSLRITGEGGLKVDADYDKDGFSFGAEAYAKGHLDAKAKVDLVADLYAAYGLFSHRWTYNVASVSAQVGPELTLHLGKLSYAKNGEITWPSVDQIKAEPENIDPLQVVKDMLGRGEAKET